MACSIFRNQCWRKTSVIWSILVVDFHVSPYYVTESVIALHSHIFLIVPITDEVQLPILVESVGKLRLPTVQCTSVSALPLLVMTLPRYAKMVYIVDGLLTGLPPGPGHHCFVSPLFSRH